MQGMGGVPLIWLRVVEAIKSHCKYIFQWKKIYCLMWPFTIHLTSICSWWLDVIEYWILNKQMEKIFMCQYLCVWSLGQEDSLEKGMVTHSSTLAWRILWTEEPSGKQSMESHRVGHHWSDLACMHMSWKAIYSICTTSLYKEYNIFIEKAQNGSTLLINFSK